MKSTFLKVTLIILALVFISDLSAQNQSIEWPFLKTYEGEKLEKVAMPLGGIGTGTVSLGGRGDLRDWEIVNQGALGWKPVFNSGGIIGYKVGHVIK